MSRSTFDNSTGWLPIDFAEVEIARRAYRSGENEYYLNGNRVRLRDITELLGSSGLSERTYSIIGQGLIDQALSQRPEERRKLFEEAAGITVHQSKRDQAQQRLQEARVNLTRARDIISELTPRLRYLKGQARTRPGISADPRRSRSAIADLVWLQVASGCPGIGRGARPAGRLFPHHRRAG